MSKQLEKINNLFDDMKENQVILIFFCVIKIHGYVFKLSYLLELHMEILHIK